LGLAALLLIAVPASGLADDTGGIEAFVFEMDAADAAKAPLFEVNDKEGRDKGNAAALAFDPDAKEQVETKDSPTVAKTGHKASRSWWSDLKLDVFVESMSSLRTLGLRREADVDVLMAGEGRFRIGGGMDKKVFGLSAKLDTLVDGIRPGVLLDLREAVAWVRPTSWLEVRAGRQVLSWGTSPMAPNSLFRKDLASLFLGRDLAFVQAPVNAMHLRLSGSWLSLDAIWMPTYEPDRALNGYPFLFHDPETGSYVSQLVQTSLPEKTLKNGQLAGRVRLSLAGYQLSLYGFRGHTGTPQAAVENPITQELVPAFAPLTAYGAGLQGPFAWGRVSLEGAYHRSYEDSDGTNPNMPNSKIKGRASYGTKLARVLGVQLTYHMDWIARYEAQLASSPAPDREPPRVTHNLDGDASLSLLEGRLRLSVMVSGCLTHKDALVRPEIAYRWSGGSWYHGAIDVALGGTIFIARTPTSDIGMLRPNTNAFLRLRWSLGSWNRS
jgi:hypothetical protein